MHLPASQPFKLELRCLRSQAFRWFERGGWYYWVVNDHPVSLRQSRTGIEFRSVGKEESIKRQVGSYFGLNRNMRPVHKALRRMDGIMAELVDQYGAMRLLQQDPWECLVSYICSQNNSIDRIAGIVDSLADEYGDPLTLDGVKLNSFPSPRRLLDVGETQLNRLNLGLHCGGRIHAVVRDVVQGELDPDALRLVPYVQANGRLMSYGGFGPKIADCLCLFFPLTDTSLPHC